MLTHFSLFSGIGGIDLAAEWAGFSTVGQVEWADYPTKVLEKHWPNVPRWRDIRSVSAEDFFNRTGLRTVDLISGGFPCQPFSVAGEQKGKRDDRYLWPEMLRVIREIKPTWVLGENVPGILRIAGKTVCEDLEREGYAVAVFNFEAAAVGAPHRRDRVFFVANRQDGNEQEQQKCDNREEHKRRTQVRYGLGAGRGSKDGDSSERVEIGSGVTTEVSEDVADTDNQGLSVTRLEPKFATVQSENGIKHSSASVADTNRDGTQRDKSENWQRCGVEQGSKNVANSNGLRPQEHEICKSAIFEQSSQGLRGNGQLESDVGGVASRIPCWLDGYWRVEPNISRVATGVKNRVDRLKCLGNAVVPQQVYPILKAIAEIETP